MAAIEKDMLLASDAVQKVCDALTFEEISYSEKILAKINKIEKDLDVKMIVDETNSKLYLVGLKDAIQSAKKQLNLPSASSSLFIDALVLSAQDYEVLKAVDLKVNEV